MKTKLKTYVIIVSEKFMKGHPKAGEPTHFVDKILNEEKIHTIRENGPLWEKRIKEVQAGRAVLSLRVWTGKPYRSKQKEVLKLTKFDGVGVQQLDFKDTGPYVDFLIPMNPKTSIPILANNDGLETHDFMFWFQGKGFTTPFVIIHFTPYRYS